jgi:hypothetical protein
MGALVSDSLQHIVPPVEGLQRSWSFIPGSVSQLQKLQRFRCFLYRKSPRPPHHIVKPVFPAQRWNVFFAYAPDGQLSDSQDFSIGSLRSTNVPLLVIVATDKPGSVPSSLADVSDALIWKGLTGYDFSAYRIALEEIGSRSPGADVLVMNDSVFGPFGEFEKLVASAPWRLTGFTSSSLGENHLQSYAFVIQSVDPGLLDDLAEVLLPRHAFDIAGDVILCQELALARVASRRMSVGSYWHNGRSKTDPMLEMPLDLLDAGLPFLKKSLLGKMKSFQDVQTVRNRLIDLGHPVNLMAP